MDLLNSNLSNVLETMQRVVKDRENGLRASDSIIAIDDRTCPLSPKYPLMMRLDGSDFASVEHFLQYCKAVSARDETAARKIRATLNVADALRIPIYRFNVHDWRRYENQAMQTGSVAKFREHPRALELLKSTHTKTLVYAAPSDTYFGCGLRIDDDNVFFKQFWRGANRLGVILDSLRKAR